MIQFNFSCLITFTVFSETLFVKPLIPDASSCRDPYIIIKSLFNAGHIYIHSLYKNSQS